MDCPGHDSLKETRIDSDRLMEQAGWETPLASNGITILKYIVGDQINGRLQNFGIFNITDRFRSY